MGQDVRREEIVVERSAFDESGLERVDEIVQQRLKAVSQNFGEDLSQPVHQANRAKILHLVGPRFFGDKAQPAPVEGA